MNSGVTRFNNIKRAVATVVLRDIGSMRLKKPMKVSGVIYVHDQSSGVIGKLDGSVCRVFCMDFIMNDSQSPSIVCRTMFLYQSLNSISSNRVLQKRYHQILSRMIISDSFSMHTIMNPPTDEDSKVMQRIIHSATGARYEDLYDSMESIIKQSYRIELIRRD